MNPKSLIVCGFRPLFWRFAEKKRVSCYLLKRNFKEIQHVSSSDSLSEDEKNFQRNKIGTKAQILS